MNKVKVLFVCMGNICRSPSAEGVFTRLVQQAGLTAKITIDSAGTHDYHIGEEPDLRAQVATLKRGADISSLRARQVRAKDLHEFDYILAMDGENYTTLQALAPQHTAKIRLFLEFARDCELKEVPDPYFGGTEAFEFMLDLIENAAQGLLTEIQQQLSNQR